MQIIKTTDELARFCAECAKHPYVTVDTEFLRERTYYAELCLVQLAMPGEDDSTAALIDTLADGISLDPLYDLFRDTSVVKVFHAARQDLEIFYLQGGVLPKPFFDTQVAAMVCGFGEQAGYETLVRKIAKGQVDKSSRFTDWSRRPLTEKQMRYAIADVTHLRVIYEFLAEKLEETGRTEWVEEEIAILMNPDTYVVDPETAWQRLRIKTTSGPFLAIVRELAKFREETAKSRNVPRNRILKDDAIMELASTRPKNMGDLGKSRLLLREARSGATAEGILAAVARAEALPKSAWPSVPERPRNQNNNDALTDLLRVLLKGKAEKSKVAQKLIANAADLDAIANSDAPDVAAMSGWRWKLFGQEAMRLKRGEIALSSDGRRIRIVDIAKAD
ncbi:ribonuclease D [Oceanomicrobium pacificus]|uniref:Ribonuclease D n=1 Tax=Oceanomicrobium pacificus TaxID=2692916 RepID=A0A6B0TMF7_9RHOB|nr:ribonuclease D [Oceanomicrobium pacificus]MXU65737.1 ribonuclease D [Oceanomicrobium pacificus]